MTPLEVLKLKVKMDDWVTFFQYVSYFMFFTRTGKQEYSNSLNASMLNIFIEIAKANNVIFRILFFFNQFFIPVGLYNFIKTPLLK